MADGDSPKIRILRLHKRWADGITLLWQIFVLLLFGGAGALFDQIGGAAEERNASLILLATMIIVAAIWQAAGLAIARVHMLLDGIDLEQVKDQNVA